MNRFNKYFMKIPIYWIGLGLILLNFLVSVLTFFSLIDFYEPLYANLLHEVLDYRFYNSRFDEWSYVNRLILGLVLLFIISLIYFLVHLKIALLENKNSEIKGTPARNSFIIVPIRFGIGFIAFSLLFLIYTFLFDKAYLISAFLKFVISLIVFLPIIIHNLIIIKQENLDLKCFIADLLFKRS